MAIASTSLCSLALVKSVLRHEGTGDDTLLETLIDAVSVEIEGFCNRAFSKTTYTEYHTGDGSMEIFTEQYPLVSITSIHNSPEDPPAFDSGSLLDSTYYGIDTRTAGRIYLREDSLYTGIEENVKVIYVAGYYRGSAVGHSSDELPKDLQLASAIRVAVRYLGVKNKRIGKQNVSNTGGSASFLKEMEPFVKDTFSKYKKHLVS